MIEREIHSIAASESSLCSSEESTFFYSSLPSISGSVSIQMTESATMSEKESATNTDTEWDAADKEYMDINSDVGSNANLDFAIGYIDQEEPFGIGIFENQHQFKEGLTNLPKARGPKEVTELSNIFTLNRNIFQSEREVKIQKQNRMRNLIRSKIEQEMKPAEYFDDKESKMLDDLDYLEDEKKVQNQTSETQRGLKDAYSDETSKSLKSHLLPQHGGIPENLERRETEQGEAKFVEDDKIEERKDEGCSEPSVQNNSELQLEEEFYSLLDKLIIDLNPHNEERNADGISNKTLNANIYEDNQKIQETQEDELASLNSDCSHDAFTQTEKIKKRKQCQIM